MAIKTLPSMEHSFTIDVKGSDTGRPFQGSFTYKRPNRRLKSEIAKLECRLNEDLKNLDEDTKFVHAILAELRHTLIEYPDWWKTENFGLDLYDDNVIFEIYKACSAFQKKWMEDVWGNQEEPAKDTEESKAEAPKSQTSKKEPKSK